MKSEDVQKTMYQSIGNYEIGLINTRNRIHTAYIKKLERLLSKRRC